MPDLSFFFFFNDTATTEIYTLSYTTLFRSSGLAVALPGHVGIWLPQLPGFGKIGTVAIASMMTARDRKSTRLNSSHTVISYAVFCLKKKKKNTKRKYNTQSKKDTRQHHI